MIWIILGVLTALVILAVIIGGIWMFNYSIKRVPINEWRRLPEEHPEAKVINRHIEGVEWLKAQKMERWEMTSFDGLKLIAYYLPAKNNPEKKAIVAMHGYHSHDFFDFAVSARYFHEAGYDILLPDQRSHGESEGKYICFGVREKYDCRDWINKLTERLGTEAKIGLMGVSMGCATVLYTLGLELPETVKCCMADCGFTSPAEIFTHVLRRNFKLPKYPLILTQKLLCKCLAGFDIDDSTLDVMRENSRPILFIHGGKDDFVPTSMSHRNYLESVAEGKEILIIPHAAHAQCTALATEKVMKTMLEFAEKHLG